MSESESPENESGQLTAEDLAGIKRERQRARKTRTYEFPEGVASFTIQMLSEGVKTELATKHLDTEKRNRDMDQLDGDGYEDFRAALIREGVTDGPPGYKATIQHIRQTYPEEILEDLAESIGDFSEISEEQTITFR